MLNRIITTLTLDIKNLRKPTKMEMTCDSSCQISHCLHCSTATCWRLHEWH